MRRHFREKIVCLFVASIFTITSLAGCGGSKKTNENVTDTEVSGEIISSSIVGESATDAQGNEEQDISSEVTTTDKTSIECDSTPENLSDELTKDSEKDKGNEEETTTKVNTETTKKETAESTTAKKTQTTVKPTNKPTSNTTQKTTSKPKPEEQTTAKPQASKAEQMAKEIVDGIITSKMTDFDKALAIHDWLIFNLDYDFTYSNYYVEETLRDRKCVCQGYALTFKMMCEMAGLDVIYVTGTGTNSAGQTAGHAWNQVKINGKWYNVDVTWDDSLPVSHQYFRLTDDEISRDHQWDGTYFPATPKQ